MKFLVKLPDRLLSMHILSRCHLPHNCKHVLCVFHDIPIIYIYLHLVDFMVNGKRMCVYIPYMDPMGFTARSSWIVWNGTFGMISSAFHRFLGLKNIWMVRWNTGFRTEWDDLEEVS